MSYNICSSTWGGYPLRYLSIAQHNSLGSWNVFLSPFNSFATAKCPPDIVCLQDPPFWRSRLPSFPNYTSFAPPAGSGRKLKVALYISTFLLAQATVLSAFFDRPDVAALDLFGVDLFGKSFSHFRILNIYNLWTNSNSQMTASPLIAFPDLSHPTLVVGDFNIHHPLPDPLRPHSAEELATFFPYFSRMAELGFGLLNQPGVYTRFPLGGAGRPSVLDLSFASHSLLPFCEAWDTPFPSTGSDHVPVQIKLSHPFSSPPLFSPNWSLIDWLSLEPLLKDVVVPLPPALPTRLSLEALFDRHLSLLTTLLTSHTPTKHPSYRSKPLLSLLLSLLTKEFYSATSKAGSSHLPLDRANANLSKRG